MNKNSVKIIVAFLAITNLATLGVLLSKRLRYLVKPHVSVEELPWYQARLANFQEPGLHENLDLVVSGDSHAHYPPWDRLLPKYSVANHGISGDTLEAAEKRAKWDLKWQVKHVVYIIGANNLDALETPEQVLERFRNFLKTVGALRGHARVYIVSLLPVNEGLRELSNNEEIRQVNSALAPLVKESALQFLDAYAAFTDAKGQLRTDYTYDGVHLNYSGNKILSGLIERAINQGDHP